MLKKLLENKLLIFIVLAIIGFCLILIPSSISSKDEIESIKTEYYSEFMEDKIEALLLEINEIESVSVLITLENSGETLYAQNQSSNFSEYVLYNSDKGQSGLKITEICPKVRGVAVVCNNGDNINIQNKIISIISSALGISSNKITVSG